MMNGTKDSGNQWVGQIPQHWDICRLRTTCEFRNGYTPSKGNPAYWTNGTIPWYRMDDIREFGRKLNKSHQYITEEAVKGGGLFEAESFILATTATIGEHAQLIVDSLANQRFTNLKIRESFKHKNLSPDYLFYYLYVIDDYCKTTTKKSTFPAVNIRDLKDFVVPLPPLSEQRAISSCLDGICGDIDALVAVEEEMAEQLQQYKLAVITHTVTKGLNNNAPLKPSNIPWLESIPQHWESIPLHALCTCNDETLSESTYAKKVIRYVEISDVDSEEGITNHSVYPFKEAPLRARRVTKRGDIIISTVRTYLRAIAVVDEDDLIVSTGFAVIRAKSNVVDSTFLSYAFRSKTFIDNVISNSFGLNYPSIATTRLLSLFLPVPPLSEQHAIAEFLDGKCSEIEALIAKKRERVALLKELKKSTIYEYVTGKRRPAH